MRHDTCYKYSDVKIDAKLVYTNKVPTGAFRGFGNPSAEWAVEQAIDLGAHALGMDPLELARINAKRKLDLAKQNAAPQADVDTSTAALHQAEHGTERLYPGEPRD